MGLARALDGEFRSVGAALRVCRSGTFPSDVSRPLASRIRRHRWNSINIPIDELRELMRGWMASVAHRVLVVDGSVRVPEDLQCVPPGAFVLHLACPRHVALSRLRDRAATSQRASPDDLPAPSLRDQSLAVLLRAARQRIGVVMVRADAQPDAVLEASLKQCRQIMAPVDNHPDVQRQGFRNRNPGLNA